MSDDVRTFEPAVEALENSEIMIGEMTPEEFEVYEPMDEPADVQPDESVSQFSDGSSNVPSPNFQFDLPKHSVEIAQPVAQPDYFGSMKGSTDAIEVNSTVSEELRDEDYEREFDFENEKKLKFLYENYQLPNLDLLKEGKKSSNKDDEAEILSNVNKLRQTFQNFRIDAKITQVSKGPMITRFEIQPNAGVKVSKIVGLSDDIALNLAATSVRIVAPIPGKSAIGIEIPNKSTSVVSIKDVVSTPKYEKESSLLKFGLGLDISGEPIVADLAKMPHLLIAGATGSGKSVCVNTIIASILLNAKPDEVKFLMIDQKVVELNVYNGIAHLILPVVTDPKKASLALNWAVNEMTQRYTKFAKAGVKDINGYNKKFELEENAEYMPRIVVIIDELSDLMMAAPNQVEEAICRLAQMARACGIHLIVATQRPSVDVITGVIKANIPSRIAFAVSSQIDSRTIIDGSGAEKLLGKGDMLYYPSGMPKPIRVQGSFISEEEVEKIVEFISAQSEGIDIYDQDVLESAASSEPEHEEVDELLSDAIDFVVEAQKASTSLIQRKFRIGYNRAARMMEALEERGIVGPSRGSKPREVLIKS
ncbi:MAG: DNA translocase FtsK, partial [Bacillota bacterium]|nr:DNA translocase FtsK [Bacillota bacterium]